MELPIELIAGFDDCGALGPFELRVLQTHLKMDSAISVRAADGDRVTVSIAFRFGDVRVRNRPKPPERLAIAGEAAALTKAHAQVLGAPWLIASGLQRRLVHELNICADLRERQAASPGDDLGDHALAGSPHLRARGGEDTLRVVAPAIARALLDAGANPDAGSRSYGPEDTPLEVLVSSCHPGEAGVQADLVEILCRAGANVEGARGDGSPLWTAITWGYRHSAERLVKCGARVDNIITAAALGSLDRVKSYFGPDGHLLPCQEIRGASCFTHGRPFDSRRLLEYAFITAAGCGRREVVEFLLTKGPDLSFREPIYRNTALDAASYPHSAAGFPHGHPDVVRLLRATGAF